MTGLHLVVPDTVEDPRQPSGGNVYDAELAEALRARGHMVTEHRIRIGWRPDDASHVELADALRSLPDDSTVLVDGLIGLDAAEVLERERRLRLWLLVHLPLGLDGGDPAREGRALRSATGVITTSEWTRGWLLATYGSLPVFVARPGVRPAEISDGPSDGGSLLCVGAVVPAKGQDVLVEALHGLADLHWSCRFVGPLDRDLGYVARLREQAGPLGDRVLFTGPLARDLVYGTADLLVVPTLLEMYGMVVTEALARGIPVVASDTGGVTEAIGPAALPGALVPPGDAEALSTTLRCWLEDEHLRARWRATARARRERLEDWSATARAVEHALSASLLVDGSPR